MSEVGNTPRERFGYFDTPHLFWPVCKCGLSWAIKRTENGLWRCDRGHFLSFPRPPR